MCGGADRRAGPVFAQRARLASGASGAYGTVLIVPLDDLPDWLPTWCLDHLGAEPAGVLFQVQQISMVFGLRLAGGMDVVVKARADDGRAVSCVVAQARLAERGQARVSRSARPERRRYPTKIDMAADLVGDTGIEPVTSSV
jgi:hypothetical protein